MGEAAGREGDPVEGWNGSGLGQGDAEQEQPDDDGDDEDQRADGQLGECPHCLVEARHLLHGSLVAGTGSYVLSCEEPTTFWRVRDHERDRSVIVGSSPVAPGGLFWWW